MKALKHLNKYFYKYKIRLILGLFIAVVARIFAVLVPKFTADNVEIVEKYLNNEITNIDTVKSQLILNIGYTIGSAIIAGFFMFLMRQTFIVVSRFIEYDLKNEIYTHYQKLSLGFYKANRTGDLMNRISEDVMKVRMYVGPALMYSVGTITLFIIAIGYMFSIAPTLTWYTIAPLPILSVSIYYLSRAINKRTIIVQEYLSKLTTFTQEAFSGISVVKAYTIEGITNTDFQNLANQSKQKSIDLAKVQAFFFPLMVLLIGCSNIIVVYVGGKQYLDGKIADIGIIVEFLMYVNMLTWPVATVGWVSSIVQQAEACQQRINEFLETVPEIKNIENPLPISLTGEVEFKNVTFKYPDTGIEALKNISFKIKPGQTIGILGNTGAGKSTILELIGRLYDTTAGEILIDGKPIQKINLQQYRNQIGYVPQDAFLFSDTIANNIKFGKENASEKEMIAAAKLASVHTNIIDFKNGYKTVLGERGVTLSGGQKQRVSIARALIKNPNLLLLDDSLSAVDTETEERIIGNFNKIASQKTCFIVSHRISTVKNADVILVLENGKILQKGTHNQLISKDGYYSNLFEEQLKQKEF